MKVLLFILLYISCADENIIKNNIYDIKYPDYYIKSTHFIINYERSINRNDLENILNVSERLF